MNKPSRHDERRHNQRVLFDAPVTLRFGAETFETQLLDISLKGCLTRKPAGWLAPGEAEVDLTVQLNGDEATIRMRTQQVHAEADSIGFHCHEIDMESISHLRRLVELNLGDAVLLERELAALG